MVVFIEWRGAGLNRRPRAYESSVFSQELPLRIDDIPEGEIAKFVVSNYKLDLKNVIVPIVSYTILYFCRISA